MSKSSGRRTRRVFSSEFKAKVALAALSEDKTLAQYESGRLEHELQDGGQFDGGRPENDMAYETSR